MARTSSVFGANCFSVLQLAAVHNVTRLGKWYRCASVTVLLQTWADGNMLLRGRFHPTGYQPTFSGPVPADCGRTGDGVLFQAGGSFRRL